MQPPSAKLSRSLLDWYNQNRRVFPWRSPHGVVADPYHVWLSEIMLQQTGTASVIAYFEKFVARWPGVHALAAAQLDELLTAWAGLGYYARARNLHKCAKIISTEMNGEFPSGQDALLNLPGIGAYTAAAISAIAFDKPAPVLDGNIERVLSRLFAITTPLPGAKAQLRDLTAALIDCERPGDAAQAMMDLGAMICTPRTPDCGRCPWRKNCAAHAQGIAEALPVKMRKAPGPTRRGAIFWLIRKDGAVLLRRRPESGLLGGMMEFPGTPWTETAVDSALYAPASCKWLTLPGMVRHVFTHFKLELTVYAGFGNANDGAEDIWADPAQLQNYALPAVMQKVAAHVRAMQHEIAA